MASNKELVIVSCVVCSCRFGMPQTLHSAAQKNSKILFYCPSGHSLYFPEKKEETKIEAKIIPFPMERVKK